MEGLVKIDRFVVKNYRSIAECDIELEPLTFFIGPNASGKTNFVGTMRFVASSLRNSLDKEIASRGGIRSILRSRRIRRLS